MRCQSKPPPTSTCPARYRQRTSNQTLAYTVPIALTCPLYHDSACDRGTRQRWRVQIIMIRSSESRTFPRGHEVFER
jgi:hypothetical protein